MAVLIKDCDEEAPDASSLNESTTPTIINNDVLTPSLGSSSNEASWWKMTLSPVMAQSFAHVLCKKLETDDEPADIRGHLLATKSMLEDYLSRGNSKGRTEKLHLGMSPTMIQTHLRILREKMERGPFIRQNLRAAKNIIESAVRYREHFFCDELAVPTNPRNGGQLARSRETDYFGELLTRRDVDECVELAQNLFQDLKSLRDNAKTLNEYAKYLIRLAGITVELTGNKLMDHAENLMVDAEFINDANKLMEDFDKLMEDANKLMEDFDKLMEDANKLQNGAKKLLKDARKLQNYDMDLIHTIKNLIDTAKKWSDIVSIGEENISYSSGDLGNLGPFPIFLANFLVIAGFFAMLMVPALFSKFAP